jgi:hypothetical protein
LISLLDGTPVYISDPLPGSTHDKTAFDETPVAEIVRNRVAESVTKATKEPVSPHRERHLKEDV